ncbi:GNAT family N-acetyltransferase [Streptococcus dentiloxodontae]
MLIRKNITRHFSDFKLVDSLNHAAFPKNERVPTQDLITFAAFDEGRAFQAFYDNDVFIGFTSFVVAEDILYIGFLAVETDKRSKGYGRKILKNLQASYLNRPVVLEIESVQSTADNLLERQRRLKFYKHNGFQSSQMTLHYDHLVFEVYYCGDNFPEQSYRAILDDLMPVAFDLIRES